MKFKSEERVIYQRPDGAPKYCIILCPLEMTGFYRVLNVQTKEVFTAAALYLSEYKLNAADALKEIL